jgi:N4-acetylcytidine amidohydrolase
MNDITFYQRFEADILAGRKTITIRDKSESHFSESLNGELLNTPF